MNVLELGGAAVAWQVESPWAGQDPGSASIARQVDLLLAGLESGVASIVQGRDHCRVSAATTVAVDLAGTCFQGRRVRREPGLDVVPGSALPIADAKGRDRRASAAWACCDDRSCSWRAGFGGVDAVRRPKSVLAGRVSAAQTCCERRSCFEQAGLSGVGLGSGTEGLVGRGGRSAADVGKGVDCGLRQA